MGNDKDKLITLDDLPIEQLFKYLLRDYKRAKVEIGKLKSNIDELEHELTKEKSKKKINVTTSLKGIPKSERQAALVEYYKSVSLDESIKRHLTISENNLSELRKKYNSLLREHSIMVRKYNEMEKEKEVADE